MSTMFGMASASLCHIGHADAEHGTCDSASPNRRGELHSYTDDTEFYSPPLSLLSLYLSLSIYINIFNIN